MAIGRVFVVLLCLQLTFAKEFMTFNTSDLFASADSAIPPSYGLTDTISDLSETSISLNNLTSKMQKNNKKDSGTREKNGKSLPMTAVEVDEHEMSIKILQYQLEGQQKRMEVLENSNRDQSAEIVTFKSENGQLEKRITTLLNESRTMNEKVTMLENTNRILQEKFKYLVNTSGVVGENIIQWESTFEIVNKKVKIIDKQGCRNVLEFKNVPEKENEMYDDLLVDTVLPILNYYMSHLKIKHENITDVWRDDNLLRSPANSGRPIFVRFVNYPVKLRVLSEKNLLNQTIVEVLDVDREFICWNRNFH